MRKLFLCYSVICLSFLLSGMMIVSFFPNVSALCVINEDWPDAPCFDQGSPNKTESKTAWGGYYDYKGESWMKQKR